eukprot:3721013-Prymnesium_polylepis.2
MPSPVNTQTRQVSPCDDMRQAAPPNVSRNAQCKAIAPQPAPLTALRLPDCTRRRSSRTALRVAAARLCKEPVCAVPCLAVGGCLLAQEGAAGMISLGIISQQLCRCEHVGAARPLRRIDPAESCNPRPTMHFQWLCVHSAGRPQCSAHLGGRLVRAVYVKDHGGRAERQSIHAQHFVVPVKVNEATQQEKHQECSCVCGPWHCICGVC